MIRQRSPPTWKNNDVNKENTLMYFILVDGVNIDNWAFDDLVATVHIFRQQQDLINA
jgi:hypothetical protein